MTPSELKYHVELGSDSHFFERSSMKFFGDTMKNYGVRKTIIKCHYDVNGIYMPLPINRDVYELYRKRPVKHGIKDSAYFDCMTFSRVFEAK